MKKLLTDPALLLSLAPYERRVIELLRNSKDKRARKLAKKRVRSPLSSLHPISIPYIPSNPLVFHSSRHSSNPLQALAPGQEVENLIG